MGARTAIARARPLAGEQRRRTALLAMAQLETSDLATALSKILPLTADALEVTRASYWSLVERDQSICCETLYEAATGTFTSGARLGSAQFPTYFAALRSSQAIDAADVARDPRTLELVAYCAPLGIGAMLDVPVWREGRLVGVLCHEQVGPPRRWSEEEQAFATSSGKAISIVLETAARSRAEERYRLVAQATGEVIWDWDLATDEVEWSRSFDTFGYPSAI